MTPAWPTARLFEHHDDAYRRWRDDGVTSATLVHVDAHPDMAPCAEPAHAVTSYSSKTPSFSRERNTVTIKAVW